MMDQSRPLLEVCGLNRFFGGLHAVANVSFSVKEGLIKAIIGPNGAGKTTLFNLISGSLRPSSGKTIFQQKLITGLKAHEIARRGIIRTFQNIRLCAHMTVLENTMLGRHTRSRAGFLAGMLNLPWSWSEEREIREKSLSILKLLSLEDLFNTEASSLPFGKQRAAEFARALAAEPKLLLLDEPASGLNLHETEELAELIIKIRDLDMTILLVEHDMSLVMDICDEIVVLNYGEKIAEGTPSEIQKNQDVIRIYLGEDEM
jgi:branched-chain amino acid transport system ATP-binding protein